MSLEQRIEAVMQNKILRFQPAQGGYTTARRGIAAFEDGQTAFLKAATSQQTAQWLRDEYAVYRHLGAREDADFLPHVIAWDDDGLQPFLVLEDLSWAHWPPPWGPGLTERVQEMLSRLRRMPLLPGMASLEAYREDLSGWRRISEDSAPFLSLGLCSPAWLEAALPRLLAAEQAAELAGSDFLHLDLRSDNLCFTGKRTILVDWNWACAGNGVFDLASWLPSLQAEGGPKPETLLPHAPELAAALSGFWAAQAGLAGRDARLKDLDLFQLRAALPWVARELRLAVLEI